MAEPLFDDESAGFGDDGNDAESSTKKSERKRQREKQRRTDLANAFEELIQLLQQVNPDEAEAANHQNTKKKRRRSSGDAAGAGGAAGNNTAGGGGGGDFDGTGELSGMTRLDVIGRTIDTLRRIHGENMNLRRAIEKRGSTNPDDKVSLRRKILVM
jgi:ferric-dicitrate binding protein FerR (iron transport regulator)